MFKLIILVLGLAIGFGVGVHWASHNPDAAQNLSDAEEKQLLEAQVRLNQKYQQLTGTAATTNPAVQQLRSESKEQEQKLQYHLDRLNSGK